MDIVLMIDEILGVTDAVVGESALPNIFVAAPGCSERVRVSAFDELNGVFKRYIVCGREQQVYVLGHGNKSVELKSAFAAVSIKSLQEKACIVLDNEEAAALPRREGCEISSGRRKESGRRG